MRRSIGSSRLLRCVLAALLVFAQIFAAAHAVGHLADLNTPTRAEHSASRGAPDGGVPVAERAVSILDHRPDLGADYVVLADEVLARLELKQARRRLADAFPPA